MSFNNFLNDARDIALTEGIGQVKKQYLQTGKIDLHDFKIIEGLFKASNLKNDYTEWFTRFVIFNNNQKKQKNLQAFGLDIIKTVLLPYDMIKQKGYKKPLPEKADIRSINDFIQKAITATYANKTTKVSSRLKRGEDYDPVHKNGPIEIFRVKSYDAILEFGKGTKWCIASTDGGAHWNMYVKDKGSRFYVIRDHSKGTSDNFYKVAAQVYENGYVEFWDAKDHNSDTLLVHGNDIADIYDFPYYDDVKIAVSVNTILSNYTYDDLDSEEKTYFSENIIEYLEDNSQDYTDMTMKNDSILFSHDIDNGLDELESMYDDSGLSFEFFKEVMMGEYMPELYDRPNTNTIINDLYIDISSKNIKIIDEYIATTYPEYEYDDTKEAIEELDDDELNQAIEQGYIWASEAKMNDEASEAATNALTSAGYEVNWNNGTITREVGTKYDSELEFLFYYTKGENVKDYIDELIIKMEEPYHGFEGNVTDESFNNQLTETLGEL
jgi:hypothetical protein